MCVCVCMCVYARLCMRMRRDLWQRTVLGSCASAFSVFLEKWRVKMLVLSFSSSPPFFGFGTEAASNEGMCEEDCGCVRVTVPVCVSLNVHMCISMHFSMCVCVVCLSICLSVYLSDCLSGFLEFPGKPPQQNERLMWKIR